MSRPGHSFVLSNEHRRALVDNPFKQRRIFIFGALGYFKFGARLEVLRRLMSYKISTTRARYIHWTNSSNSWTY